MAGWVRSVCLALKSCIDHFGPLGAISAYWACLGVSLQILLKSVFLIGFFGMVRSALVRSDLP
jgi:hypothetical protein